MSAKHWTPAKKHLEYRAEPTSLEVRNQPDMRVPRRLEHPEHCSQRLVAQARQIAG
jgi:hypothetical protein